MTILTMDVDACLSTQNSLTSGKEQLDAQITNIATSVNNMVGKTWIAPGANQFQTDLTNWSQGVTQQLAELQQMAIRLQDEIKRWEDVARTY